MNHYRAASPPSAKTIRLEAEDVAKIRGPLFVLFGGFVVALLAFGGVAQLVPRAYRPFVLGGGLLVGPLGFMVGLLAIVRRMRELRYLLEIREAGAGMRLLAPNGAALADTWSGTLSITKINYTRRGRHGSAWLRPGFHVRHRGGDHLVGTLFPELPWDGVAHDPRMPEFELRPPEFSALCEAHKMLAHHDFERGSRQNASAAAGAGQLSSSHARS